MAIRVDYTPVGAALSLARTAGEGQNYARRSAQDAQLLQFALQRQSAADDRAAQNQAFALQNAYASRATGTPRSTAATKSPLVDHVAQRMLMQRALGEQATQGQLADLQSARDRGLISPLEFEESSLQIKAGDAVKFERPPEPKDAPVSVRRAPFMTQRAMLMEEFKAAQDWAGASNIGQSPYGSAEGLKTEMSRIQQRIKELTDEEQTVFGIALPGGDTSSSKPLTKADARGILAEAGGDVAKARKLAQDRGYQF